MRARRWARNAALVLVMVGAGLGCRRSRAENHTTRDSAGVQIIENRVAGWEPGEGWTIDSEPRLDIGATTGDSAYLLHRVIHARRLRDGRIAVANSGSSQIRIFDSAGRHLSSIGRRGDAPGEFRSPWWIAELPGDSLIVLDIGRGFRFSVFGPTGAYARTFTTPVATGSEGTEMIGQFSDGSMLVRRHEFGGEPVPIPPGETRRGHVSFFRIGLDGAMLDSVGRFPNQTGGGGSGRYLWGPWGQETVHENTFYFGAADRFEIEHRAQDGTLRRLIRLARPNRPVTDADRAEWKARAMEGPDARRFAERGLTQEFARMLDGWQFAPTFPAHFYLRTDPAGNLWVQEYSSAVGEGRTWSVFDRDGVYRGDVTMPERFRVFQFGEDFVLGSGGTTTEWNTYGYTGWGSRILKAAKILTNCRMCRFQRAGPSELAGCMVATKHSAGSAATCLLRSSEPSGVPLHPRP